MIDKLFECKTIEDIKSIFIEKKEDIISNPNFKKWFGKSKVVKGGKPLVVYHGTGKEFDTFDLNKTGSNNDEGMWGKGFYLSPHRKFANSYGSKIMRVYASIENPFIAHGGWSSLPDGVRPEGDSLTKSEAKNIRNKLIALGHDGVFQIEKGTRAEFSRWTQIIAFYPNQIKSANNNNGEFSTTNANIYEGLI